MPERGPEAALRYFRRRTLDRAVKAYMTWIGRALGWWTLAYLVFWAVVYFIAGVETLVRLERPLPATLAAWVAAASALVFAALGLGGKAPSVSLDRRDLYRLALAPMPARQALRLRMNVRRARFAFLGAAAGGLWTLLAPYFLHLNAPWAAPALALLGIAYADAGWSRYARREGPALGATAGGGTGGNWDAAMLLALAVILAALSASGTAAARFGALAALTDAGVFVLAAPAALMLLGLAVTRRTLAAGWPRRFLGQSLVLTHLQAMRTFQLIAGMAGLPRGRASDAGERQRLLAALHDRPGARKPRRSLPLPADGASQSRAFAWRAASALHRLPRWVQLRLVVGMLVALLALLSSAANIAALAQPQPLPTTGATAATTAGLNAGYGVALGVLLSSALLALAVAATLGPAIPRGGLPVEPLARTGGRLLPGALLAALLALPAYALGSWLTSQLSAFGGLGLAVAGAAGPLQVAMAAVALYACCALALEKYSSWTGSAPGAWECVLVAALLTAMPVLLLVAFGAPGWVLGAQLALAVVLYLIAV